MLSYHQGPRNKCVDLGCGHGVVARYLSTPFAHVLGVDPSPGMIAVAKSLTPHKDYPNVHFQESSAESLRFLANGSVDIVVSGQAAHWFNQSTLFPEMSRILRENGTLAFWGYKDHVFVDYPEASKILMHYAYGNDERLLGPYWSQPGRLIVENKLRDIQPPKDEWEEIQRIEYEPGNEGPKSGEGTLFMSRKIKLGECMNYIRTWSAFHAWQEKHPEMTRRQEGGKGDILDEMFDEMLSKESDWRQHEPWEEKEVEIEWGSGLILARKK